MCNLRSWVRWSSVLVMALLLTACGTKTNQSTVAQSSDLQKGEELYITGEFEAAIPHFSRATQSSIRIIQVRGYAWRGRCQIVLGRWSKAKQDFAQGLARANTPELLGLCSEGLGDALRAMGKDVDAIANYRRALVEGKGRIDEGSVRYKLGLSHIRAGHWSQGRDEFRLVVSLYSKSRYAKRAQRALEHPGDYFMIQIGSFSVPAAAEKEQSRLKATGYEARILHRRRESGSAYAVAVGRYSTWQSAQADLQGLKKLYKDAFLVP